ncbi:MAG: MFS transporter [Melioribacteraceae bacterium]|nr:MFS transporter [Melioribacteraceae bacterium]MCF8265164.1 MFS transporter [Melioribacteraceae bacterium]MCF8413236.1 MFS transporter [Melioribacteraceae bacterium]
MSQNETTTKIKFSEKVSYGFGDFASSMFWKLFSMFLLFFYTDVFGISAAAVGTMFLVTRIWDAANDPLMGIIGDRTKSRWGKFRPYLLFVAVPFAIVGILTFTTPDLSSDGKLIYAYVTYTLMMMVYTAVNVPYSSLMGVMTNDTGERTTLASYRFIGAFSGGLFVTATANTLVEYFSAGRDQASGYQLTIAVYAVLAAVFFILTFAGTKERLKPALEKSASLKEDLKDITKNAPWFIMLGAGISILIFNSLRDASILYYFKYYVGDQTVMFFGEVSQSALASAYMSIWLATNMIGVVLAKPVSAKIGKKNTFMLAGIVSAILSFIIFFIPPTQISLIFLSNILIGISAGIVLPLVWSMYADIADYSEWKTGRRATGLIFSSSSMSQKFGWTLGGAISGWLLAAFGFEANTVQTADSLLGIRLMISIIAGVGALISVVFMYYYPLSEDFMGKIETELELKRAENIEPVLGKV